MPRAGSGWHYNLVHDLVVAAGGDDARQVRRRYLLGPFLTEVNCNIRTLSAKRLAPVMLPVVLGKCFAIKTHSAPSAMALRLLRTGRMRASYIYRDPRAALLSAYEYGQRARQAGTDNAFSRLETFENALEFMLGYVRIWEVWMGVEGLHHLRYEDFLEDYEGEVLNLIEYLGSDPERPSIREVVGQYQPGKAQRGEKGLHFRHGEAERFRKAFSTAQLERANQAFGGHLERMGYRK